MSSQRDVIFVTSKSHALSIPVVTSQIMPCYAAKPLCLQHRQVKKSPVPKRINVLPLKTTEMRTMLSDNLNEALDTVEITDNIESSWKALRDATHTTALEVLGLPLRKHQDWFDDQNTEAQKQILKMHQAHKAWIDDKNSSIKKKTYKTCKGQVQKALRQMRDGGLHMQILFNQLLIGRTLKPSMMVLRKYLVLKNREFRQSRRKMEHC